MLRIRREQMAVLDEDQERQFRGRLCQTIQQDYSEYAGLSPVILSHLIALALQRARSYGFAWQSTLAQFVYLMAAIAPNFDLHPAIHAGLVNRGIPVEERIAAVEEQLPAGVWAQASARASTLGWFLTADAFAATPAARIAAALANALPHDLVSTLAALEPQVVSALARASSLGFETEDGHFVFAACRIIYGEGFETRLAWAAEALDPGLAPDLKAALLRARIAIDTAAWL